MDINGALLDMDGTLYRGSDPIDGGGNTVTRLREMDVRILFLTNSATSSCDEYVARLADCGIDATTDEILSSAESTAAYIADERPDASVFVVGEHPLRDALTERGLDVTYVPRAADTVVVGLDRQVTYVTLTDALRAVTGADLYVATNGDVTRPRSDGLVPSTGMLLGAIEAMTDREPDAIVGKPSQYTTAVAAEQLGADPENCLVVGDRLDTDIRMGAEAGMTTVLVCSGVTDRAAVERSEITPTHVIDSIAELPSVLAK